MLSWQHGGEAVDRENSLVSLIKFQTVGGGLVIMKAF